ncbi:M28 family peptidase [Rhodococcus sp. GA1]|uniref:M28 family peptidase n=1 Tax=Rhodococcus sp. GA1 TaxID=2942275 RepID=UPI0020CD70F4|nr:M28 family peptidase [Rhodococcus sp. GA1]
MTTAAVALTRCAELNRYSSSPDHLTRVYLSPEHRGANTAVDAWMRAAGLEPRIDAAGNIWGRRGEPGQKALVLGSHLDTVPDAGSYDGMLGVVMAIAVAERLRDHDLPFALEVVGFSDEEGTRFGKPCSGHRPPVASGTRSGGICVTNRESRCGKPSSSSDSTPTASAKRPAAPTS